MKTIGILGGMTPASTAEYYSVIVAEYTRQFGDYSFPPIIIYSVSLQEHIDFIKNDDWDSVVRSLIEPARALERAGADFICLATNTTHYIVDRLRKYVEIPFVSIIDATVEEIQKKRCRKVGLMGTKFTMTSTLYKKYLQQVNIETVTPTEEQQDYIHRKIFTELANHDIVEDTRTVFNDIISSLIQRGAEGIILGCTEIPLLIDTSAPSTMYFNTLRIHTDKALKLALNQEVLHEQK